MRLRTYVPRDDILEMLWEPNRLHPEFRWVPDRGATGSASEAMDMRLERRSLAAGRAQAAGILRRAMLERVGSRARLQIGRVVTIGSGLSRDLFGAEVELVPDPDDLSGGYVVLLPRRDAIPGVDARTGREIVVLERLAKLRLPFRVPRLLGAVPEAGRLVLVREFLPGVPLDLRAGNQPGAEPWEVVGRLAAAIHRIDPSGFRDILPGHATPREHRRASLDVFAGLNGAEEAWAWARAHLASAAPPVLLHGDLLGQNVLLKPGAEPGVIDWEYAMRGDPAYDLAIVTRGVRRPFQVDRGLDRLLEAYALAGGVALAESDVRFHEVCMAAGWYREALAGASAEPPDEARRRLLGIVKRARAARS